MKNNVSPWDVKGEVDYDYLIKDFGLKELDDSLVEELQKIARSKGIKESHYLRRKIFFGHRDLDLFLKDYKAKKPVFLYTGRSPSGDVHFGHFFVWEFTKWLQDVLDIDVFFQFPDEEKFLFKEKLSFEEVQNILEDNLKDVAAMGFNPNKTHFIINTKHSDYLYGEAVKIAKKLTFSQIKGTFGLKDSNNIGSIFYTSMQTVPCILPDVLFNKKHRCLIPYGVDQDAHFRLTRDVVHKLGHNKPCGIQSKFLPSLTGDGKLSSSEGANITLKDSENSLKKKINKYAFSGGRDTLEEHRKLGGNPEIDASYKWLYFLEEDDFKLQKIYEDYKSGKLLSGEIKKILIDKLTSIISEHKKRKEKVDLEKYYIHNKFKKER